MCVHITDLKLTPPLQVIRLNLPQVLVRSMRQDRPPASEIAPLSIRPKCCVDGCRQPSRRDRRSRRTKSISPLI